MATFRAPAAQAAHVMKAMQGHHLRSVGTVRNYEQGLTRVAEWMQQERLPGGLRAMTPELAINYLEQRGQVVGQKALDMERQAMQAMMQHVTGRLAVGGRLPVIKSEHAQVLTARAYTAAQVALIAAAQTPRHGLATELAYAAGLRAHELLTLRQGADRAADHRPALASKWQGRDGVMYTVHGKGGLVRDVLLPHALAQRLEAVRLDAPTSITDRGIHYLSHYDISGGQRWSNSVSAASVRVLGWSTGAHGLRHAYAQQRMAELQATLSRDAALTTVSQEMGHFRPEITETYLR
ncbi:site-specific integrase [Aeromonas cavernicola]|uniref:Integrase n=1 Tax=Aeromonas cavernicola TaxID=1006623 RepID=A0A2H9U578_9GAMM|nr:site-specific integrase [Aeromonas cavernicola]PJG59206.1 integrase [Aeromonas cavernicola]